MASITRCMLSTASGDISADRAVEPAGHFGRVAFEGVARPDEIQADVVAGALQEAGGDKAIAAVVAGATEHGDARARLDQAAGHVGHGDAGVLHQRQARHAVLHGQAVGGRHLLGRQKLEPSAQAR